MPDSMFENPGCWSFVLNQFAINAGLPFELAPNCFINKATEEQKQRINEVLSKKFGHDGFYSPSQYYEYDAVTTPTESGTSTSINPLPEAEWRYYVVTTPDNGHINHNLHLASNISAIVLEISALHFFLGSGHGYRSGILQNHFDYPPTPAKHVGIAELHDLAEVYRDFTNLNGEEHPEILRAMKMFDSLSFLLKNSTFHVLGLFAIIEMLITHNPKLDDRGDSITHQMQSKIPLLSRRFHTPLDYSLYFQNGAEKKVWSALYKYRSSMAHGGVPDFAGGELKILKDANNADTFLREVVKALLRHSLKEPQLYRDLRNC